MNAARMAGPLIARSKEFLFDEASEGQARFGIGSVDDLDALGSKLAKAVLQSFNEGTPVKGIYFYGHIGRLKEILLESFLVNLENGKDLFFNWSEGKPVQRFDCRPAVTVFKTLDRRRRKADALPEADEDGLAVVRWTSGASEDSLEKDRIEIELFQSEDPEAVKTQKYSFFAERSKEMIQTANLAGFGSGIAAVEAVKA